MKINKEILDFAKKIAMKSQNEKQKMSAIVLKNNSYYPYLYGFNYHVDNLKNKPTIHAEEDLIIDAAKKGISLNGNTVLVYRHSKKFGIGSSKPCLVCQNKLLKSGVKFVVFYDFDNGWMKMQTKHF